MNEQLFVDIVSRIDMDNLRELYVFLLKLRRDLRKKIISRTKFIVEDIAFMIKNDLLPRDNKKWLRYARELLGMVKDLEEYLEIYYDINSKVKKVRKIMKVKKMVMGGGYDSSDT